MAGVTAYHAKNMLDWALGGAAATQPASRWIGLATQSPTSVSAFDAPVSNAAFGRQSWNAAAMNSPQGSATNRSLMSYTATAICTIVGWNLYDRSSGGTRIAFGTLSSSVGCASGDTFGFAVGALKITLA